MSIQQTAKKSEYRSIGLVGEHSFTLVLPKDFARDVGLKKGDYVRVTQQDKKIVVEAAE